MTNQERADDRTAVPGDADDGDVEVEVIVAQIEETRGDLSETIDEIGRRLEPGNVAREAGETVRTAATRKVDDMTSGIQDTWTDVRRGDASGIVDTIKSNPIPTAMVALGVGMLFMSRGSQSPSRPMRWEASNGGYGRSSRYGGYDAGYGGDQRWTDQPSAMGSAGSRVSSAVDDVGSRVSSAVDDAGTSAQRAVDEAGRRFEDVADNVQSTAWQAQTEAQRAVRQGTSQARRMFDENPLAVGAIALAAGAAIAVLAPSTDAERRALGPTRDRFVDQAERTVTEAIDSVDAATAQSGGGSSGSSSGSTSTSGGSSSTRSTGASGSTRTTSSRGGSSSLGSGGTNTSRGNKSAPGSRSSSGNGQGVSASPNQGGAPD